MSIYESKRITRDGIKHFFKHKYNIKDDPVLKYKVSKCYLTYEEAQKEEQKFINKLNKYKDSPIEITIEELYKSFLEDKKTKVKFVLSVVLEKHLWNLSNIKKDYFLVVFLYISI